MLNSNELINKVKVYNKFLNPERLDKAYNFAVNAHKSQKRASGDPYSVHPIEVANILTELKLDSATITTGLLHDTIEDTFATYETIKEISTRYEDKNGRHKGEKARINLIIGGDNLNQLKDWYKVDELLKACRILVVPRLRYIENSDGSLVMIGEKPEKVKATFPEADIEVIDFPGIAISGSKIRERINQNKTI